eukprot:TRINITY_DN26725_c0_g1_i2.p1 TRINITY_DN26725_c0_g1~~TRINITY_DN26725_c0_g1_i2.p1  ORF type:complete len:741 (-),score=127.80 TRINITY_DN26725_c0_g1_i2:12-2234(-)
MELLRTRLCEWHPVGIDALSIAPPGRAGPRLAVGRANGALELWDTETWHLCCSSPGRAKRSIRSILWLPDSSSEGSSSWRLITAGLHREVTEWDVSTLEPVESIASGGGAVWMLCRQSDLVFAACDDGSIRVISVEGGAGSLMYQRRINVAKSRLLCVSARDEFIYAGGSESRITKWSISSGTCEGSMQVEKTKEAHTLVWNVVALADGLLASGDSLGLVLIWDTVSCSIIHRFAQHQADVLALAASADGRTLLSGGIDAKIACFAAQGSNSDRWVFRSASFYHKHDIRAIAVDDTPSSSELDRPFVSGGVAGRLSVHLPHDIRRSPTQAAKKTFFRPLLCSSFSPLFQKASVAQESRLLLCQKDHALELWYLQEPKDDVKLEGSGGFDPADMPEAQLLLRITLTGTDGVAPTGADASNGNGDHICASAISQDGSLIAASNMAGTRLFHLTVGELQVQQEKALPKALQIPSRTLLFCGSGLLAVAAWRSSKLLLLDCAQLKVLATFEKEHSAPISLLAAGGPGGEWLASADLAGVVQVFSLDGLQHHARVPLAAEGGIPTAIGFDSPGKHLVVVTSTHSVTLFDVEGQTLAAGFSAPISIPRKILAPQARVCGVAAPCASMPGKLLLWGHSFVLSATLSGAKQQKSEEEASQVNWNFLKGIRHVLALTSLDEAKWGRPLSSDAARAAMGVTDGKSKKKRKSNSGAALAPSGAVMALSLEVSPEAAERSLPVPFERKRFSK